MKKVVLLLLFSGILFASGFTVQEGQNETFAQSRRSLPDLTAEVTAEDGTCRLWLQLKNTGDAPVDKRNIRIVTTADGIVIDDQCYSVPMAPGKYFGINIGHFVVKEKTPIKVVLDANNNIKEQNEANNEISAIVECKMESFAKPVELVQSIPTNLQPMGPDLAIDPVVLLGNSYKKVRNGETIVLNRDDSWENSRAFLLKYYMLNLKGKAVSGVKNEIFYNGVNVATQSNVSIGAARAETDFLMIPTFGKTGDFGTVKIVVDSDNKVNEPDETNNTITFYVKLQGY